MTPSSLRIFVAVELSAEHKTKLKEIQTQLKSPGIDVRWVDPGQYHITLKFLGAVEAPRMEFIRDMIQKIAQRTLPFNITLKGLGAFPSIEKPQIIWIGITKGHDDLENLNTALESQFHSEGFNQDSRKFHAHVTLGKT